MYCIERIYTYVSIMGDFTDIFNSPVVEGESEHGNHKEVVVDTPLQGDTKYVSPTGDAVENIVQENVGQGSYGEDGV